MSDLRKLIEAVGEGTFLMDVLPPKHEATAYNAFSGSLDAAGALHDALLSGWGWETGRNATFVSIAQVWKSGRDKAVCASSANPARAWLLAILRALEGGEDGGMRDG